MVPVGNKIGQGKLLYASFLNGGKQFVFLLPDSFPSWIRLYLLNWIFDSPNGISHYSFKFFRKGLVGYRYFIVFLVIHNRLGGQVSFFHLYGSRDGGVKYPDVLAESLTDDFGYLPVGGKPLRVPGNEDTGHR